MDSTTFLNFIGVVLTAAMGSAGISTWLTHRSVTRKNDGDAYGSSASAVQTLNDILTKQAKRLDDQQTVIDQLQAHQDRERVMWQAERAALHDRQALLEAFVRYVVVTVRHQYSEAIFLSLEEWISQGQPQGG